MDSFNPQTKPKFYRFKDFFLNLNSYELFKNNQKVDIEPKLFNILVKLLQNPSQVISREQLLEDIWQKRVVTPNAISRAIYELRKILDDPEQDESLIKTVRGRGFQLNCEVFWDKDNDFMTRGYGKSLLVALSIMVVIFFSLLITHLKSKQTPERNSSIHSLQSFVILPLQTDATDIQLMELSHSIVDYLSIQLHSSLNMKVISPDNFTGMELPVTDLWKIQESTHASFILEGYVTVPGENALRLNLTLYETSGKNELLPYSLGTYDFPWPGDQKSLAEFYKQRKISIREIVDSIKPNSLIEIGEHIKTLNPGAFRLVLASQQIIKNGGCDEIDRAQQLLEQALRLDPEYAYAWHKLMGVHIRNIWICGRSRTHYDLALQAANKVEELEPGLYESVFIAKNSLLLETNHVEDAYQISQNPDWNNPDAIYRAVSNLRYAGFLKLAKHHIDRILQIDPFFYNIKPIKQAPNTFLYLQMYQQHISHLASPGNQYHDYYRSLNLFLRHEYEQSKKILLDSVNQETHSTFEKLSRILLNIIDNKTQQAVGLLDELFKSRNDNAQSDGEMTYKLAQLFAVAGESEKALQLLELSLQQGFFPAQYWLADPAMESIRNDPEFTRITEQARARHRAFAKRFKLIAEF